jgi:hypothetical protein
MVGVWEPEESRRKSDGNQRKYWKALSEYCGKPPKPLKPPKQAKPPKPSKTTKSDRNQREW